jgi:hypothetical protein
MVIYGILLIIHSIQDYCHAVEVVLGGMLLSNFLTIVKYFYSLNGEGRGGEGGSGQDKYLIIRFLCSRSRCYQCLYRVFRLRKEYYSG